MLGFRRKLVSLNRIEVSRSAIWENFDYFQNLFEGEIWPVVKANAYGHGIKQITTILSERKFTYLVADSYYEALKIWEVNPEQRVLLIGSIRPENYSKLNFEKVTLMVQDIEALEVLAKLKREVKIHLKVDTGMRRQGIPVGDLEKMIIEVKKYKNIEIEGVMSHLADADNVDESFTKEQVKNFAEAKKIVLDSGLRPKYWHLAATSGIKKIPRGLTNAARLGIGMYLEKKAALRMVSTLTKIGELEMGERVSYNGTFVAPKKMRYGVIPVGYYEGLQRRLSNTGRILGRVCMNLTVISVDDEAKLWDEVTVISNNKNDENSIENMAKLCETIPYEILAGLDGSIRRGVVG